MITCRFFGGRLAEVMHTIASLFHIAHVKNININNIKIPLNYMGKDFYNQNENVIMNNFPIFKKISKCFSLYLDTSSYRECDIANNWKLYYNLDKMKDNVILTNHWLDFIYNTNIYKSLYYQKKLWDEVKFPYNQIYKNNTLGIHVRRGDFILIENNREKYSRFKNRKTLTIKDIHNCINHTSIYDNILIFSDDIEWCKQNIVRKENIYFIEGNKPYKDLILMSLCDNLMKTPGSTFSKMASSLH